MSSNESLGNSYLNPGILMLFSGFRILNMLQSFFLNAPCSTLQSIAFSIISLYCYTISFSNTVTVSCHTKMSDDGDPFPLGFFVYPPLHFLFNRSIQFICISLSDNYLSIPCYFFQRVSLKCIKW